MGEETDASTGGAAGDPQRLKRIAAAAYDYENDARWAGYWSNFLVPPHLASRPDVVDHFMRKFYQPYIDPGSIVEPMSSLTSALCTRPAARSSSAPSGENIRAGNSGSSARSTTSSQPPPAERSGNFLQLDGRAIQFSINAWKPRAWNMPTIHPWLQSIIVTKDFVHLMFSLMMFTSNVHFKIALLPVLCWSLDHVARFLRRNFTHSSLYRKYLEDLCLWVEANNTTLSLLCSNAEITLGSRREIVHTFMYFHLLKLMYHAPVTSGYHWARIVRTVNPYIYRYAPFLNTPISAVQRWWLKVEKRGSRIPFSTEKICLH